MQTPLERVQDFCTRFAIDVPILMAPMAGACPPALAAAVSRGGGMGACGALLMDAKAIGAWAQDTRALCNGAFQMNLWIPDPAPERDFEHEKELRAFLADWGPAVSDATDLPQPLDFDAQCQAILDAGPAVVSSIMGLYPPDFVTEMKARNIAWFATATTIGEAVAAHEAGADVIVAQGMEAGGHRGAFQAEDAGSALVGLFALLPGIVDAVDVPVVATGGIADARGISAALMLGASAVQIGTGLLRTPEAGIPEVWGDAIAEARPEDTTVTRAFSGRLGRSVKTAFLEAIQMPTAPKPAPYPVQRYLTQNMRTEAAKARSLDGMQAWAGQSAKLTQKKPAGDLVAQLWADTQALMRSDR